MMSLVLTRTVIIVVQPEDMEQHLWRKTFFLTWFSRLGFFFAHHVTRPILPLYLATFGASSTVIGAVMAAFTLMATITRVPIGLLIDRTGRKPFLLSGISLFTVGMSGYLWAPSILWIVLFRILHGIGWSGCTTAVATLAADVVPQKRRGELIGYAAMASNIGGALGPVVGFAVFHRFDYDGVFLCATAILIYSLLVALPILEPKKPPATSREARGWMETIVVRETIIPAIVVIFVSFGHGGIFTFLPFHALQLGLENPGLWFGLYAVCLLLSRPVAGPLSDRISRRAVILPGLVLNLVGILLLALASSPAWLMTAAVVLGFGYGAAHPALMTIAVDQSAAERRGQSLAQFQLCYDLGIGVGSLALGAFLDLIQQDFAIMYLVTAAFGFCGLFIYWKQS